MLLFDQNLSPRLVQRLADVFPGAIHVRDVGLERAGDAEVEEYALGQGLVLVTKDADFRSEPLRVRVIWLRIGNGSVGDMEATLRRHADGIHAVLRDPAPRLIEIR